MKRILFFLVLVSSLCGYSQSIFDWQNTAPDGNWKQGASGAARWSGGFWDEPGFGILKFNNNHQTSMTNNVPSTYSQHQIQFGTNATSSRSIGASVGSIVRLYDFAGNDPKIENYSTATHTFGVTFNLVGDGDSSDPLQINPINGNLVFNGTINNSGSWIDIYGNNSKVVYFNGAISGSGGLSVKENSTVVISNAVNTYSGSTSVDAGTLVVQKGGHSASITSNAIAFTFASSSQAAGVYDFLPGQLAGNNSRTITSNLSSNKVLTFNYNTGKATICDLQTWYLDADNDGYYTGLPISSCDSPGLGYKTTVLGGGDCNDGNPAIHPNGEICFNNIDDDCDGNFSNGCTTPPVSITSPLCGTTLNQRNAAISCNSVSILGHEVQYRFRIENENFDVSIVRDVPNFTILQASYAAYVHPSEATYNVYVALVVDGELQPESAACSISVAAAAVPGQSLSNCNTVLTTPSTLVFSPSVSGAVEYQFEILKEGNIVATFETPSNYFHTSTNFTGWNYGTTYTVRSQSRKSGETFGNLNLVTPCSLTYPAVPVPAQAISTCSTSLTNVSSLVFTTTIFGATSYQFELTEGSNTYTVTRSSANFHFTTDFANWNYGKTYSVRTRVARNDGDYGLWSTVCTLTSPAIPTPAQGLVACSTVMTSVGSYLYSPTVFGATDYQFEVTSVGGFYDSFTKSVPYFRLTDISGWVSGTDYSVRVMAKRGDMFSDLSLPCTFKTPGTAPASPVARMAQIPFAVKAYPNPYSDAFQLDVATSDKTATIDIKVYDMLGRLVESKMTTKGDLETTTIGSDYPSGVYNVIVTQNEETKAVRVIKR
jgi:autotransporter-associated beta strand protein